MLRIVSEIAVAIADRETVAEAGLEYGDRGRVI